ncbi:MAG TPA: hypothetical protein VK835_02700 [Bacteroidia bacterium]|jgi:hypothetical protein|nr:hypothetical protein [Bacteroidia bacterium]
METKPDPKKFASIIVNNIDKILPDLDKKVALTKEKHFVVIQCTDAKDFDKILKGTAYNFTFCTLNSPPFKLLNLEAREVILSTRFNNNVGLVIVDPNYEVTVINYKRDWLN